MDEGTRGLLTIVPTPIGNLDDITLRALECLRTADAILAEDTRRTRKLCGHHGITTALHAFHAHSSADAVARFIEQLTAGRQLALVSDAGTPLISDPGAPLVLAAREAGIAVAALPGASAVTTALCVAGIPFDAYRFIGFLPRTGSKRTRALDAIAKADEASVLFESPRRLSKTLADLAEQVPDERQVAVCRELTKIHEEVVRGASGELAAHFAQGALGEITVVVEGARGRPVDVPPPIESLDPSIRGELEAGLSLRDAARVVAERAGLPRRDVYQRAIQLQRLDADD